MYIIENDIYKFTMYLQRIYKFTNCTYIYFRNITKLYNWLILINIDKHIYNVICIDHIFKTPDNKLIQIF